MIIESVYLLELRKGWLLASDLQEDDIVGCIRGDRLIYSALTGVESEPYAGFVYSFTTSGVKVDVPEEGKIYATVGRDTGIYEVKNVIAWPKIFWEPISLMENAVILPAFFGCQTAYDYYETAVYKIAGTTELVLLKSKFGQPYIGVV